jgi:ArsR family transcriptional regulator
MSKQPNLEKTTRCGGGLAKLLRPRLFKALADQKRVSLLLRIAEEGRPCTVSQVADGSGVDMSVVSRHLALLRDAAIVSCVKRGKEVWYTLEKGTVVRMLRDLADALEACCPDEYGPKAVLGSARNEIPALKPAGRSTHRRSR